MSEFVIDNTIKPSETAWGHFPGQHYDTPHTEDFVKSFFSVYDTLQKYNEDLLNNRWLDTAVGVQLDGVGDIVQIARDIKDGVVIPFFGFKSQPAGRGFGQFRLRKKGEGFSLSYSLPDVEYRLLIKAKIILNNSHGTINEIIESAKLLYGVASAEVRRTGVQELTLRIPRVVSNSEPLYKLRPGMLPVNSQVTLKIISG